MKDKKYAFWMFEIAEDIDCEKDIFAISVWQQGNCYPSWRLPNAPKKFEPSRFNITVVDENNEIVKQALGGWYELGWGAIFKEGTLKAGTYLVHVDPIWETNPGNSDGPGFKDIMLDIYTTDREISITEMEDEEDIDGCCQMLISGIKKIALNDQVNSRKPVTKNGENSGFRGTDAGLLKISYDFVYIHNTNEDEHLNITCKFKFKNYEVFGREITKETKEEDGTMVERTHAALKAAPGEGDIVVLRKVKNGGTSYSYNYSTWWTSD